MVTIFGNRPPTGVIDIYKQIHGVWRKYDKKRHTRYKRPYEDFLGENHIFFYQTKIALFFSHPLLLTTYLTSSMYKIVE